MSALVLSVISSILLKNILKEKYHIISLTVKKGGKKAIKVVKENVLVL